MPARPSVLVTRDRLSARALIAQLHTRGFEPLAVPCLEIEPLPALKDAAQELISLTHACWLVVTSATAVRLLAAEFVHRGHTPETVFGKLKLAAVGEKTARALRGYLSPEHTIVTPTVSNSGALAELLVPALLPLPTTAVVCRGIDADEQLPRRLLDAGATVLCFSIYRTDTPVLTATEIAALRGGVSDPSHPPTILVSSAITGRNLLEQTKQHAPEAVGVLLASRVIAIGPGTATALVGLGFRWVETAAAQSTEAMLELL